MTPQHANLIDNLKDAQTRARAMQEAGLDGLPSDAYGDGYLEHQARMIITDMRRRYGFDGMRERIAELIMEEAR